jgi:PDZ domain-containing protein
VRRLISPWTLVITGVVLCGIAFGVLWLVPSNDYILLPDRAHPLEPLVKVPGERPPKDGGGVYFVDALVRKATLLESLFPSIRNGATLVPASAFNPPGFGEQQLHIENAREMQTSQQFAAAVALEALGYHVVVKSRGVLVSVVDPRAPAAGKLLPTDVVVAVDGRPVRTPAALRQGIRRHRPGQRVRLTVRDSHGLRQVTVGTIPDPRDPSRPIIGIIPEQAVDVLLPVKVHFDLGDVGGPSAGLAFALDLMEELGRNVDRGYRVAATGEIGIDGAVHPVGGIKQKVIGANHSGVDVFLAPGENAPEARRYARGMRVIAVDSFRQALRKLATLPPKT